MDENSTTLHFVYNVDATPGDLVRDFVSRLTDPDNYPCKLCDITYGRFFKKQEWSRWVAALPVDSRFHTRSRFARRFPEVADEPPPAIFVEAGRPLRVLISAPELDEVADLDALERLIEDRLRKLHASHPPH